MSRSTYTHTAPIEELLKGLADAAAARRAQDESRQRSVVFDAHSIVAAAVALFIFVPGCTAATLFLLQTDDAIASPVQLPAREPAFVKSDRLPLPGRSLEADHGFDPTTVARSGLIESETALHMQSDSSFLGSVIIRGRIDDMPAEVATVAPVAEAADVPPEDTISPQPKQKPKRHAVRARPPKLVAEIIPPEPEPPSLMQRLFGSRSL
jgi:hypothetical protein